MKSPRLGLWIASPQVAGLLLLLVLLTASLLAGVACSSCAKHDDDGTQPRSKNLPKLDLRDDTPDLLITWLDQKGDYHVVQHPSDVPEEGRDVVRIVTLENGHGDMLYVADLRHKKTDGTYPVRVMARSAWDLIAAKRREKRMADLSPTASASATDGARAPPMAPPSARLQAIVYGASWCSACHGAEAFLRSQGVTVVFKDIERDAGAQAEMQRKLHKAGLPNRGTIPVLDIRGRILVGFDKRAIKRAIRRGTHGDML